MRELIIAALATLIFAIPLASTGADKAAKVHSEGELPKWIQHLFNVLPESIEEWQLNGDPYATAMVKQFFPFVGREDLVQRFFPGAFEKASTR